MKKKEPRQVLALTGAVLLTGMYVVALICAFMKSDAAQTVFRIALGCTFLIPVLLYMILMVARVLKPRKSSVVDAIVFDLGNVLMDFPWRSWLETYDTTPEIRDVLRNRVMASPLWQDLDLSVRPYGEILDDFGALAPEYSREIHEFLDSEDQIIHPFWYTPDLIRSLRRQGYRVYYLSNWSVEWYHRLESRGDMDCLKLMDGGVFSFDVHLAKPDPAIYQALFDRYGLSPERCLFLDDMRENVEQAQKLGMSSFVFTDYNDMLERFASLGIRVGG